MNPEQSPEWTQNKPRTNPEQTQNKPRTQGLRSPSPSFILQSGKQQKIVLNIPLSFTLFHKKRKNIPLSLSLCGNLLILKTKTEILTRRGCSRARRHVEIRQNCLHLEASSELQLSLSLFTFDLCVLLFQTARPSGGLIEATPTPPRKATPPCSPERANLKTAVWLSPHQCARAPPDPPPARDRKKHSQRNLIFWEFLLNTSMKVNNFLGLSVIETHVYGICMWIYIYIFIYFILIFWFIWF